MQLLPEDLDHLQRLLDRLDAEPDASNAVEAKFGVSKAELKAAIEEKMKTAR